MRMTDTLRSEIERFAIVYGQEKFKDGVRFFIYPVDFEGLQKLLRRMGDRYDVRVISTSSGFVLELKEYRERIWINVALLIATFVSTTVMGATMFGKFDLVGGMEFSLAIMFVLGFHEMGHYIFARRWGMKTSLPYFIPFPSLIGTLGAVIRHRGVIPNRKALFDVGVSGPIFGIVASIVVTYIGLKMRFVANGGGTYIILGIPPLFDFIAKLANFNGYFIHPVAFAGWVGMFVTFLNLIPVGQLDGGHVLRAMVGEKADYVSKFIPLLLIALGFLTRSSIWFFWGLITVFFAMHPHPRMEDESPLDFKRICIGVVTFAIGLSCFTPVPFKLNV